MINFIITGILGVLTYNILKWLAKAIFGESQFDHYIRMSKYYAAHPEIELPSDIMPYEHLNFLNLLIDLKKRHEYSMTYNIKLTDEEIELLKSVVPNSEWFNKMGEGYYDLYPVYRLFFLCNSDENIARRKKETEEAAEKERKEKYFFDLERRYKIQLYERELAKTMFFQKNIDK